MSWITIELFVCDQAAVMQWFSQDKSPMNMDDLRKLHQHHTATIGLFVAFWIFFFLTIFTIECLEVSSRTQNNLIGTLFGSAIVLCLLQFRKRCPDCGANLGWQVRLGIPENCHKCGAKLRQNPDNQDKS